MKENRADRHFYSLRENTIKRDSSNMETLKRYLVVVLVSGLVSGCSQDISIQRRYSVFIEDLFGGTSLMVKVNARGVGDLKVNSRDDRFSLAIKDQICKASGPWSEMRSWFRC